MAVADGRRDGTTVTVLATTSLQDSGLFASILPKYSAASGVVVRVVALGTGRAVALAERGDADVLLVHHRPSEDKFVADGFGVKRHEIMRNDFVLVGPKADPAGIRGTTDAAAAFARIAAAAAPFCSRGDRSGTHLAELALWQTAGSGAPSTAAGWYRELGAGMGATLTLASGIGAYTLVDRGTWISFAAKGDLELLVEGDPRLANPYAAILVSKARHPQVNDVQGQAFIDWLKSAEGQKAIADFRIGGRQPFTPCATP